MEKPAHISLIKTGLSRFTDALLLREAAATCAEIWSLARRRGFWGYKQVVTLTDGRQYQVRMDKASVDGVSYDYKDRGALLLPSVASSRGRSIRRR